MDYFSKITKQVKRSIGDVGDIAEDAWKSDIGQPLIIGAGTIATAGLLAPALLPAIGSGIASGAGAIGSGLASGVGAVGSGISNLFGAKAVVDPFLDPGGELGASIASGGGGFSGIGSALSGITGLASSALQAASPFLPFILPKGEVVPGQEALPRSAQPSRDVFGIPQSPTFGTFGGGGGGTFGGSGGGGSFETPQTTSALVPILIVGGVLLVLTRKKK